LRRIRVRRIRMKRIRETSASAVIPEIIAEVKSLKSPFLRIESGLDNSSNQ
jgi:hypothetical protein